MDNLKLRSFQIKLFIASGLAILFVVLGTILIPTNAEVVATPNGNISVIIADSKEELKVGLSGRNSLPANQGMLFVFADTDKHEIWMKDMQFSIDIIWLDQQKSVVDIAPNTSPATYPKIFLPKQSAKYVLEIPAGQAKNYNIAIGSKLSW
jgi:uncharacterized protein